MRRRDIDKATGERIRSIRTRLGISQQELGRRIGVSAAQVSKYETGVNRISAGLLKEIAHVLGIPLSDFYATSDNAPPAERSVEIASMIETLPDRQREAIEDMIRVLSGKMV